jgi:hypothetical protein
MPDPLEEHRKSIEEAFDDLQLRDVVVHTVLRLAMKHKLDDIHMLKTMVVELVRRNEELFERLIKLEVGREVFGRVVFDHGDGTYDVLVGGVETPVCPGCGRAGLPCQPECSDGKCHCLLCEHAWRGDWKKGCPACGFDPHGGYKKLFEGDDTP